MAYSREIFQWIKNVIPFQQAEKEADSHYTKIGGVLIRVSNHCTWMKIWDNYFMKNPKDKGRQIVSLVFEDGDDTYSEECLFTTNPQRQPIKITEYVYKTPLSKRQVDEIIKSLKGISMGKMFSDTLGLAKKWDRVSVNPDMMNIETTRSRATHSETNIPSGGHGMDYTIESKIHKNMKQTKKITESQLRTIVAESVKKVLNEAIDSPYGSVSNNPLKPTFDDVETQGRLKSDSVSMLAKLPTERFMKYWNMRMKYDDPDMVDAIYAEYYKRHNNGEI